MLVLVLLALWQGQAYVEYSDGVYAASARLVLHGAVPYRDFAAAQPPGVFYLGALLLALGESVEALRRALAGLDLILAGLVAVAVWRLTGRRMSASLAGIAALLTPWALKEHAQLLPETFAAPLLVGAVLAASSRRTSLLAGVLGACAVLFKVAFLVPAAAIAAAAAEPALALEGLLGACLAGFAACWMAFGSGFWRGAFQAQTQTGLSSLHYAGGLWAQAAWNLAPLLACAALALRWRHRAYGSRLFVVTGAAAAGSLLLLLSLFKRGSYLNVLVVVEPPLLILAACGVTWLLERVRPGRPGWRGAYVLAGVAAVLVTAEIASLLVTPQDPGLFARPFAASAPGLPLSDSQVRREFDLIRRCPPGSAYSGPPYLAFAAGRRLPGNQPDQFIITHARADRSFLTRAVRDVSRCP